MDPDLRDLLDLWLGDHDPGESRREELIARLRADAAFRLAFVEEVVLLGKLRAVQSGEPRWLRLEDRIGWSAVEIQDADDLAARVVQEAMVRRPRTRRVARWLAAAAVVLVAAGVYFATRPRPHPVPAGDVARIELATVVKVEGVAWTGDDPPPGDGTVLAAGRVRLAAGRLTLAFFSGVSLTVEGPADLELLTADRVVCHHGKLRVRVPRGAEGFTILADRCEVVDLGTEFAVNHPPGGKPRVMVFEGDAAVSVFGAGGKSVSGSVLVRDQSVELDAAAGRIREVPPDASAFVPLGQFTPSPLAFTTEYPRAVLASRPWGYWRFEALVDGKVPNEVRDRPGLIPVGGVALDPQTPENRAATFRPYDPAQCFRSDGTLPMNLLGDYALEVWAQADLSDPNSSGRNALLGLIDASHGNHESHVAYLELMGRGRRSPHEPCSARFVDRWPSDRTGGVDLFSRRTVVPTLWRHYVCQKVGDVLELYVDGERVGTAAVSRTVPRDRAPTTDCYVMLGRLKPNSRPPDEYQIREFQGRADELAVYDHALTPEEIRRHADLRVKSHAE